MDFIEQWFGVSPDGGDGSTEGLIIAAVAAIAVLALARFVLKRAGWLRLRGSGPAGGE